MIKYEFNSIYEFISHARAIIPSDMEGEFLSHPYFQPFQGINCTILKLNVELAPAVMDEEGNVLVPAIHSPKCHVDILYDGGVEDSLATYEVMPTPMGVHTFAGWEEWYEDKYNKLLGK